MGRRLLENALAALKNGYKNVSLTVELDNEKAVSLYKKQGFRPFRLLHLKEL